MDAAVQKRIRFVRFLRREPRESFLSGHEVIQRDCSSRVEIVQNDRDSWTNGWAHVTNKHKMTGDS